MISRTAVPNVVERKTLDYIPYYIHLGQFISFNRTLGREIKKGFGLAWKQFWSPNFTLSDNFLMTATNEEVQKCFVPLTIHC